jgi:hypothetical protein
MRSRYRAQQVCPGESRRGRRDGIWEGLTAMRLVKAHINKYKSITDSGTFEIDDRLTALVGKNEAGKTAVLEATYRFNPLPSGHPTEFDPLRDYPRSTYNRDKTKIADVEPMIYTTHSLFMIQPRHLDRCRTVEDIPRQGTTVSNDVWAARPETVFPLLGALGVDMSQALIVGPDQLAVEGPADVAYLTVMSDLTRQKGKTFLDPRWTITPVGGLDKIPTFIALLGASDLNIAVIMDVAAGGNQKITSMVQRGLLPKEKLIPLTDITGTSEADIEDLFDTGWYLKLLKESKVSHLVKSKLTGGGRIVKRVEVALGGRFDHYQPASYLMRSATKLRDEVDDVTIDRFARLFARINNVLGR